MTSADGSIRVALLSPCFWPEVRRGGERIVRELADGLLERGHHPRLITSHRGRPTRTVEDGLPIARNWRPPGGRLYRRNFEDHLTHVPFSYLSLRRGEDDIAHAVYPTDALAAARWTERTGRPSILAYLGIPNQEGLAHRRLRIDVTLRAIEGCTAVTALSRTAADAFGRWLGVDAQVTYPGVDLEAFTPGDGRAPEPTVFCAAATDEPRKRVDLLARAVPLVRRERRDVRLVVMRPSALGAEERLRGLDPEIRFAETVERPADLAPHYRAAWVSVLPSFADSFGIVLVESLACGTPVVGSDRGAIPEVIDREAIGQLFEGEEPEALARALLEAFELAEDPATPAACRARAGDFSTERSVAAYEELYRKLLGRTG